MAKVVAASPVVHLAAPAVASLGDTPETEASIAAYLASGERVAATMDLAWKVGAVLFALVLLTWLVGALPGAYRLF